jgi:hypothetical protein
VLAFEFDKYRDRRAEDKERVRLLGLIRHELVANQEIVNTMLSINAGAVLNTRPKHNIWDGISSKLTVLSNDDLLEQANLAYFSLACLEKDTDMYDAEARRYQYVMEYEKAAIKSQYEKAAMKSQLQKLCDHFKKYITESVLPHLEKSIELIDAEQKP